MNLSSDKEKISYSLGLNIGMSLNQQGFEDLDFEALRTGIQDIFTGQNPKIDPEKAGELINNYFQNIQKNKAEKNLKEGEAFLRSNSLKEGVNTLPSGLQYKVIKEGNGPKPKATDQVTTHYHGTLIDGRVFDSSVERGQPATFPVNGVIQGWVEALQLMQTGAKWRLFVPSNLAYGSRGASELIGPNTTLIFDVELLAIK